MTGELRQHLAKVRENLNARAYPNEAAIRSSIVYPMLAALGWRIDEPRIVYPEYNLKGGRRIDIGLFVPHISSKSKYTLRCIIELKAHGSNMDADEQLFGYAFHTGAPIALFTDGQKFLFYCPFARDGESGERLVRHLDVCDQSLDEVATALSRYLSFANTRSGKALSNAKKDLKSRKNQSKSASRIPDAWDRLVRNDAEEKLLDLLTKETSTLSKYAPHRNDVTEFIESLTAVPGKRNVEKPSSSKPNQTQPTKHKHSKRQGNNEDVPVVTSPSNSSNSPQNKTQRNEKRQDSSSLQRKPVIYYLSGVRYSASSAIGAYCNIIDLLAAKMGEPFLLRLETALTHATGNKEIARSPSPTTRQTPKQRPFQLKCKWWVNRTLNNPTKRKHLKKACDIAGIPFDDKSGLWLGF